VERDQGRRALSVLDSTTSSSATTTRGSLQFSTNTFPIGVHFGNSSIPCRSIRKIGHDSGVTPECRGDDAFHSCLTLRN